MCIHEDILNWIYIILVMSIILSSMSIKDIWDTHSHFKTDIWVKPNDAKFIAWAYSLGNKCISVFIYPEILEKFNMDISYRTLKVILYMTWDTIPFRPRGDGEVIVDLKFHIWIPSEHSYILQNTSGLTLYLLAIYLRVQSPKKGIRFV